jgi:hypothetical protein
LVQEYQAQAPVTSRVLGLGAAAGDNYTRSMQGIQPVRILLAIACCSIAAAIDRVSTASAEESKPSPVDFVRDIQPILAAHCHKCHGATQQEGGLRLITRDAALAGGDSGQKGIVPGDPTASRLVKVINGTDDELVMPPEDEANPLRPDQVELIARWVREGANWPAGSGASDAKSDHWAFKKPMMHSLPTVRDRAWPRRPLDFFVLERIEHSGLHPADEADRHTIARRVWLDLVGLPPTLQEVDAFVADQAPDAYERMVDRALADPGFGERWARVWLDLARYADSKGYGSDPLRTIWRYRDWVIDAFNNNLSYDQFTIEQLAGDLLSNPSSDQILATAFHRNTMANDEGGTDDEEFRVAAVKDRIETTMQVWMGLTVGCAKCHSHKFDPITQREYYQAYAIFDQTEDADRGDEEPRRSLPDSSDTRRIAELRPQAAALNKRLAESIAGFDADVARYYLMVSSKAVDLQKQIVDVRTEIDQIEQRSLTPIMRELPPDKKRVTRTMIKGNFRSLGEVVEPAVIAALHPLPSGAQANRMGLARWLVDSENPLTARVAVNRFWAQLFGTGLVATEEDFGTQGLPPTHPELLDWLAVDFMQSGWNVKQLLRAMVTSATYRQSSRPSADAAHNDPQNRLLSRGPRFRLEAEVVRDQALAVSGLLSRKQGGPSVYPPQPDGLWRAAFNSQRTWATSTGADRYRRGLYTYWRRTVPYPSMAAFDAPSREICTLRRISTNTPLQAFVTLNDPVYVEAAQALARRIVADGGSDEYTRAFFGLRLALQRPPHQAQIEELVKLYQNAREMYRRDSAAATEMATNPLGPLPAGADPSELAAWTVVGNVILNLDGVLTKR